MVATTTERRRLRRGERPNGLRALPSRALSSFHFKLTHENGTTPMPLNLQLTGAEGDFVVPDRSQRRRQGQGRVAHRQRQGHRHRRPDLDHEPVHARLADACPAPPSRDLADPAALVTTPARQRQDAESRASRVEVDGVDTYETHGHHRLRRRWSDALPIAEAGQPVKVELWIGVDDSLPRRVRMTGRLDADEPTNIVRQIDLSRFDVTVEIKPP